VNDPGLASDLAGRVPAAAWTADLVLGAVDQVPWFAVLRFDQDRNALVVTADGRWSWTSRGQDGAIRRHQLRAPAVVGVLPLLELAPDQLAGKLSEAASVLRISPEDLALALPVAPVLEAAFATRSDYWIERALLWIETIQSFNRPIDSMRAVIADPRVRQQLRHRTRKALTTQAGSSPDEQLA
jgi:hypothetical protein